MSQGEAAPQEPPSALVLSPSRKGLLSSVKEDPSLRYGDSSVDWSEKEHANGLQARNNISVLVPDETSIDALESSGTFRWKHFLFSPVKTFHSIRRAKEEISMLTPSVSSEGVYLPMVGEVKWDNLKISIKEWLRNPKNLALLLWGTAVGFSGAALFLVMVGFLDHAIRKKSVRDDWFEINNQILNALFTLMCLYLHPQRILHLYLLYRWHPDDIKKLRAVYCKGGAYKPHEWPNMLVVVSLLNLNCFAQYALCGLNWGYRRSQRPALGVGICLAVAIGAPAAAGIYSILSPLGKDYEEDDTHLAMREDIETQQKRILDEKPSLKIGRRWKPSSRKATFISRNGELVKQPEWRHGLFDCSSDPQVAIFTAFCGFCVFGWNMERLGLGNRFVHIVTFILLCTAPYWIFTLAATNINDSFVRHGLSYGGIVLCVFGLLYGGFWRIQMRRTYHLPAQKWCCGHSNLTDCTQWLFCSLCSLCQEVRTSEYYKIRDSKFYDRVFSPEASPGKKWTPPGRSPLSGQMASSQATISSPVTPSRVSLNLSDSAGSLKQTSSYPEIFMEKSAMDPPIPPVLTKESADHM